MLLQHLLQRIHLHTVVIHADAHDLRTVGAEGVQRTRVGRVFHDDHGPRLDHALSEVSQALLGAAGNEDIFVVDIVDLIALHKLHQILTQGVVAVRGGILDRLAALLVKNLVGDAAQILQWEKLLAGQTAGKGHHLNTVFCLVADLGRNASNG